MILAVDPGWHNGAAVVLSSSGEFRALCSWQSGSRGSWWEVTTLDGLDSGKARVTTFGALCELVREVGARHQCRVGVVEGLRFGLRGERCPACGRPKEGRSSASIATLAGSAMALAAAVEQVTRARAVRPTPDVWRKVLKLGSANGEAAKRAAMVAVGGKGRRRIRVRFPCTLPAPWCDVDHAAEAACMGEWARLKGE